jgi:hypothetical protein
MTHLLPDSMSNLNMEITSYKFGLMNLITLGIVVLLH